MQKLVKKDLIRFGIPAIFVVTTGASCVDVSLSGAGEFSFALSAISFLVILVV